MAKQYIVSQCCRCDYTPKETEENKGRVRAYKFSKDLNVGTYTEDEFRKICGDEFIKSGKFEEYCEIGWIKVIEVRDITEKTVNHFNKL